MAQSRTKQAGSGLGWFMSVREMEHKSGISYPVFEWSYGRKDGIRGGELQAWPLQGTLVFEDRRGERSFRFTSVEDALAKIREYGWGEPSHIRDVFKDVNATHEQLQVKGVESEEEVKRMFVALKEKWKELV